MEKVSIREEFIRLDSLLKLSGIAETGGHAKLLIKEGQVKVNNEICTMRGKKIHKGETVSFGEKMLTVE